MTCPFSHMTVTHTNDSTHLVEWTSDVDGAVLDDGINCLRDGSGEVWVGKLRVEEDLWTQEPLVAHVHCEWLHTQAKNDTC